ncbi:MAG: hypothetical protein KAI02_06750 [Gammaproteobacteria bacterium]|nr:hypothetical protein [Gammaproteobacteria bacterium]
MGQLFILRGFHWGYNDETFYPCGNYIKSTFTDQIKAEKALLSLERSHWQDMDLGETYQFFDTDQPLIDRINKFTLQKCGSPLFTDDDRRDVFIPTTLSDDDFMEFLKIAHLKAFKLTKFEDDQKFYSLFFPDEQEYLKIYDEGSVALVYSESLEQLKNEAESELEYHWDEPLKLTGELSALSDSPNLLKTLIDTQKGLNYKADKKLLSIKSDHVDALFSVNELLKQPLFEIKTLSVDEIKALEENLIEEW